MKVAIYCRLSDEDKNKINSLDDSESIQNQKSMLNKYAAGQGWDVYKIYSDDDYSGLDGERPEWNQMLKDAEARRFDIVLCKSQSRFTRDMELVEKYLHHQFMEWGIRFIGLTDYSDTLNKGNKKQRQIIGLTNEWYCEDVSESIRAVLDGKRNEGQFIGSFAAYGYRKDPGDRNKLLIDEEAAQVVKGIFGWYLDGYGAQRIARMLNDGRIPNPTRYKQLKGLHYVNTGRSVDSGLWNKTTVKRILKNETYIGNMIQGKRKKVSYKSKRIISTSRNEWIKVENTHQPVIEKELFFEVQRRIAEKQRSTGDGQAHIFSTKVRCADCRSSMHSVSVFRGNERYTYLRCRLYAASGNRALCSSHAIRLDSLRNIVAEKLHGYMERYLDEENIAIRLHMDSDNNSRLKSLHSERCGIERQILQCTQALKHLYYDRSGGEITEAQFIELKNGVTTEQNSLKRRYEEIGIKLSELEEKSISVDRRAQTVKQYKNFKELTHTMVNSLIDFIEIGEKNSETEEQKVKIHWNF